MPGLGKSGTSRISFLRCSQLIAADFDADPAGDVLTTTLLQCEMTFDRLPFVRRIPALHPRARRAVLARALCATGRVVLQCRWQALPPYRRRCFEPTRRRRRLWPLAPQTSEIPRPAHARKL